MKKALMLIPLLLTGILVSGCFGVDGDFKSIRNTALKEAGRNFKIDTEFSLGSFELWILEGLSGIIETEYPAEDILASVSDVQIGIYNRKTKTDFSTASLMRKVDSRMNSKGWKYIVKAYEENEMTAVYLNSDSEIMLKEIFILSIDNSEIVIVQVKGDLEKLIETAIKEHGIHWNKEEGRKLAAR